MLMGSKEMTQLQKKVKNRRKTKQNKKKQLRGVFYKIPETTETKIFVF